MAQRISNPAIHHIDKDTGAPLSGGQLFFFEIRSTTPKDTFSDEEGTIPNTNPVILDASGVEPDIFGTGSFRVVLQNSNDVQQWERDPVSFEPEGGQFDAWVPSIDYFVGNVAEGTDGNFYSSIQTPNINNDPLVSPTFWIEVDLLKRWSTLANFDIGDPVTFNSEYYISLTTSNTGNQPDISPTNWQSSASGIVTTQVFDTAASLNWIKPIGVKTVVVELIGAGGGSGASDSTANRGSQGGGAGGYVRKVIDVTGLDLIFVVIGTAGAAGLAPTGLGSNGSASSMTFLSLLAGGGTGGFRAGQILTNVSNGGSASGGDVNIRGGSGTWGSFIEARGGDGGESYLGGGVSGMANGNAAGNDAVAPGGGGGGTSITNTTAVSGGAGADGMVIFTEYR